LGRSGGANFGRHSAKTGKEGRGRAHYWPKKIDHKKTYRKQRRGEEQKHIGLGRTDSPTWSQTKRSARELPKSEWENYRTTHGRKKEWETRS